MWFAYRDLDARNAEVHLARMDEAEIPATQRRREASAVSLVRPYAETLAMVAASTLIGMLVAPRWGNSPVDLLYLPTVLAAAGFYGLGPGILAAIGSALAFNFYFTQPYHTFRITSPQDVATVALLFLVALVTSKLAAGMRAQARAATASAARNATIAGLARRLLSSSTDEQIAEIACRELGRLFDCNALLMSGQPEPHVVAARPNQTALNPADMVAAAWTIQSGQPAGRGAAAVNATEWIFHPVRSDDAVLGAIGLARDDGLAPVTAAQADLLANLIDQIALALERSRLETEARGLSELRERNRIRSALLSTIGQDIEPRLSAIADGVNQLRRDGSAGKALLPAIGSEVQKLRQYLSNLLDVGPETDRKPIEAGHVTIDLFHRIVRNDGRDVHLTPKEYTVLAELAKYPGRVLSHAHLLRSAWGPANENQVDYLRVAVRALRQKLERDPARPVLIVNEPSVGYRLVAG
jgi:two-component system sensor histidine kinase KdpD